MKNRPVAEKEILKRLSAGLSQEEIQRVLAGALNSLDQAGVDRLLQGVGPETGAALRRILDADNPKQPPLPGKAKVKEEWERTWEDWDARIAEACDSEGNYVIQEHHWEEPYFDPLSVTHDLEPIAARMRKLLARVFEENIDPEFSFAETVQENLKDIDSSLPDYMDPFGNEGFRLGPEATACLIDWEWRMARRKKMSAFQFVNQLCDLEASSCGPLCSRIECGKQAGCAPRNSSKSGADSLETSAEFRTFGLVPGLQGSLSWPRPSCLLGELPGADQPRLDLGLTGGQRPRAPERARRSIEVMHCGSAFFPLSADGGEVGYSTRIPRGADRLSARQVVGWAVHEIA
jgi:hypothetical protein